MEAAAPQPLQALRAVRARLEASATEQQALARAAALCHRGGGDGAELSGMAEVGRLEWDADAEEVRVAAGRLSLRLVREDGAAGELHLEWAYQAQRLAEAIFGCLSNP